MLAHSSFTLYFPLGIISYKRKYETKDSETRKDSKAGGKPSCTHFPVLEISQFCDVT
jgi:hypothetical protein